MSVYPESIKEIANVLLGEIEKHFPGLTKKTFDSFGYPERKGSPAQERAEMCIYLELIKAGAIISEKSETTLGWEHPQKDEVLK